MISIEHTKWEILEASEHKIEMVCNLIIEDEYYLICLCNDSKYLDITNTDFALYKIDLMNITISDDNFKDLKKECDFINTKGDAKEIKKVISKLKKEFKREILMINKMNEWEFLNKIG